MKGLWNRLSSSKNNSLFSGNKNTYWKHKGKCNTITAQMNSWHYTVFQICFICKFQIMLVLLFQEELCKLNIFVLTCLFLSPSPYSDYGVKVVLRKIAHKYLFLAEVCSRTSFHVVCDTCDPFVCTCMCGHKVIIKL